MFWPPAFAGGRRSSQREADATILGEAVGAVAIAPTENLEAEWRSADDLAIAPRLLRSAERVMQAVAGGHRADVGAVRPDLAIDPVGTERQTGIGEHCSSLCRERIAKYYLKEIKVSINSYSANLQAFLWYN